jgi:hypothetical protein
MNKDAGYRGVTNIDAGQRNEMNKDAGYRGSTNIDALIHE